MDWFTKKKKTWLLNSGRKIKVTEKYQTTYIYLVNIHLCTVNYMKSMFIHSLEIQKKNF